MGAVVKPSNGGDDVQEWMRKIIGDISKQSAMQQVVTGGVSGVLSGYLFARVGRTAALVLGGAVIVGQIAIHQGYITVNWKKVDDIKEAVVKDVNGKASKAVVEVRKIVDQNRVFAGVFAGGFFVGMAVS